MSSEHHRPKISFDYQRFDSECAGIIVEKNPKTPLIEFIQRVSVSMREHQAWPLSLGEVSSLPIWQKEGLLLEEAEELIQTLTQTHKTVSVGVGRDGGPVLNEIRTLAVASLIGSLQTAFPTQENVFLGDLVTHARIYTHPLPLADHMHTPDEARNQHYDKVHNPFSAKNRYSDIKNN